MCRCVERIVVWFTLEFNDHFCGGYIAGGLSVAGYPIGINTHVRFDLERECFAVYLVCIAVGVNKR